MDLEQITADCATADEFAQALRAVRVYVCADDIRAMFGTYGRDALVAAIKARAAQVQESCPPGCQ
jgi:hypothetical protein